jgi:multidrug efflux pump subunit AcrB
MIALVRIALSRPYTFVVLALLLLIIGPLAALRTPTDIFPDIRIPVIGVVWQYTGLPPDQMSGRITTPFQRALTTTVNDIEHIVANSYNGVGIIKIFFQPNVDIRTANAQVTAISQTALPAALAGIVWILFATHTTLSVPALTGAIMCMGVATANSVLVISFARERYQQIGDPIAAAIDAGFVRFRPVLMTALAMIIGMTPMALGLGEGGEQNAPLGRAVIGGLIFATIATLMFVPVVFSMVHKMQDVKAHDGNSAAALEKPHAH